MASSAPYKYRRGAAVLVQAGCVWHHGQWLPEEAQVREENKWAEEA